jgi:hypothetical protein
MKKLKKWQIAVLVIGVLAIIGKIIDRVEYYKDPEAYRESSIAMQESLKKQIQENDEKNEKFWNDVENKIQDIKNDINTPAYTINSHSLDKSNPYWTYVRGTLTANKDSSRIVVKAEFYDSNGVVLDQSSDYISKIEKGKTYEFNILANCDNKRIASYKMITE